MENKFKPILFSTEMVKAILGDRKKRTRRLDHLEPINKNPDHWILDRRTGYQFIFINKYSENLQWYLNPKYMEGNILYVRETFQKLESSLISGIDFLYKADIDLFNPDIVLWSPSIHMPKKAARIFLEVTNVRVERLQDITEEDCIAEGILQINSSKAQQYFDYSKPLLVPEGLPAFFSFSSLWCSIYGSESWEMNPWVWVYEFKVIEKPADFGIN